MKTRRFLAALLALLMLFTLVPTLALADDGDEAEIIIEDPEETTEPEETAEPEDPAELGRKRASLKTRTSPRLCPKRTSSRTLRNTICGSAVCRSPAGI